MPSPLSILHHYWQHDQFRPLQEEITQSVLDGKDTLALLPTGGGKSICFQVPALLIEGTCLVISPLIALMRDQVDNLNKKEIPAVAIHSGLNFYEVKTVLQEASAGRYKFIYLSPERLETNLFKEYLPVLDVSLIVIDEAHCVSQWGYDFRPPYLRIANLREELEGVPVIALTASATPIVQEDIQDKLRFSDGNVFRQSFERPNLSYSCFRVDSKVNKVLEILKNVSGSSIVYCSSRKQTKELSSLLQLQGIASDFYHAGLPQTIRDDKQQAWLTDTTRVMVCTNAFGMGIDKPEVRTVIHFDSPDCLENYYQEAGRAGRDGKRSFAVLLYQEENISALQIMPDRRFPPIPEIKRVYQSLADFLQIPVGTGEGQYFDFDLLNFLKNFQLDSLLVINTLKVLEQEGHISFSENIFLPTQVEFTVEKENLASFQQAYPEFEPLIQCMLRSYQGIFENRVSVHEKQLSWLIRLPLETIQQQLLQLQSFGIIAYMPQKDTPQIHFLLNRAPAQYLVIDQDEYLLRKKQYQARVENMLRYIALDTQCRSQYIAQYFGDNLSKECGICDVCLNKKKKEITDAEFKEIHLRIIELSKVQHSVEMIFQELKKISEEKIWTVLDFLQAEHQIEISEEGMISLTNDQKG